MWLHSQLLMWAGHMVQNTVFREGKGIDTARKESCPRISQRKCAEPSFLCYVIPFFKHTKLCFVGKGQVHGNSLCSTHLAARVLFPQRTERNHQQ